MSETAYSLLMTRTHAPKSIIDGRVIFNKNLNNEPKIPCIVAHGEITLANDDDETSLIVAGLAFEGKEDVSRQLTRKIGAIVTAKVMPPDGYEPYGLLVHDLNPGSSLKKSYNDIYNIVTIAIVERSKYEHSPNPNKHEIVAIDIAHDLTSGDVAISCLARLLDYRDSEQGQTFFTQNNRR